MPISLDPQLGATVTHLRLLTTPAMPDLPTADQLLGWVAARRPGELHEALSLSRGVADRLAAIAAGARVSVDVAGTVLLEAGAVVSDAGPGARVALTAAAHSDGEVRRRLSAAEADYLRTLRMRRCGSASLAAPATLSVPVRLLARLAEADVDARLSIVDVETALSWEAASLLEGRTMAEWAFFVLTSAVAQA